MRLARIASSKARASTFLAMFALAMVWSTAEISRAQSSRDLVSDAEKAAYEEALVYCRENTQSSISLRDDKRVLCLSGWIFMSLDFWTAYGLEQGGLVVVRSQGGEIATTIKLADLILSKQATVIVDGYCLGNCANYLFVASLKTFVPKDALVAWRNVDDGGECIGFSET